MTALIIPATFVGLLVVSLRRQLNYCIGVRWMNSSVDC